MEPHFSLPFIENEMTILPVIDLLEGHVVRGVGGNRSAYRPIVSQLTSSSRPIDVAHAIRERFDLSKFYVADLDAILFQRPNTTVHQQLSDAGFELLLDAGIRSATDVSVLTSTGVRRVVVGLETCPSPDELTRIIAAAPRVTFSIDLKSGVPIRSTADSIWSDNPQSIVRQAVEAGAQSVLLLDLADVGMGTGGSTDSLCRSTRAAFPYLELLAGGGVRGPQDLTRFRDLGVDAVLVASALHDGRIDVSHV